MIKGYLVHLSFNFWADREVPEWGLPYVTARPYLRFDDIAWHAIVDKMVEVGLNTVVIDLGDGVRYESHPEIAVDNAWTTARLREELARARAMGLEPIPKLNFSACHDVWMGPYAKCVSTPEYHTTCRDLIAEVIDLFDTPRLFHLGMDEETTQHQRYYEHVVIRQYDLWWNDLFVLIDEVEKHGVRPWIWSDYVWHHPDSFFERMPKTVLQSNWYYSSDFGDGVVPAQAYRDLDSHSYDQVPTASTWTTCESVARTVEFCLANIAPRRLHGFLQTVWKPTLEETLDLHMEALELAGRAFAAL
jgi:hypothetical protein